MLPSSVHHQVRPVSGAMPDHKAGKKAKARRPKKGLFGLLSGWTVDSQALSDELKD
ncbi:MAG: hypothetical protein OS112_06675 [Methanoregula sp.]|nr:MAG: hypothetical protein OS112_06675 [Methanoregula sp.]